ncbi:hypothetical protein Lal_00046973 [Lupinus albus]|nr:hypothetical protein Lal_00046973 [Lupinus albus]
MTAPTCTRYPIFGYVSVSVVWKIAARFHTMGEYNSNRLQYNSNRLHYCSNRLPHIRGKPTSYEKSVCGGFTSLEKSVWQCVTSLEKSKTTLQRLWMEEEMNLNHEIPEAVDEIDVSEDENINEVEEFDFEEIDFGSLNEDEMYGMKKGFGIRKYHTRWDKDGEILWQSFFCDREGFRDKKNELVRKRAPRKETRCGCLARMKIHIDKEKGDWYVSFFVDDHNHELVGEHYGGMIASNRSMTETDIALMNTMREVGIGTGKIFGSFAGQSGGYRYIGFSKKDMYNQIQRQRIIGNGDAESALQYLKEQSKSDSAMYWRHSVDEEGKLQQLFWADGCSIFDYSIFGDVLAFDATYGRNKYKFPVVIFSGVNHHKQTTVFAAGIVSNETEETYVWLLGNFLEAMNGKHPKCVITDGDLSMKNAIKRIFPATHHRLCACHICNNAGKNIKKNNFHKDFQKVMYADVEIDEFNMMWEELIAKHALHNNAWASQIFDCRSMWARSYIRGKFFAGLHTTSHCEGLHSQMGRYVESGYNVTEFLHHFQRCLSYMRNNEVMEDFKSSYGDELLQTPYHSLEGHAASIYTRVVFKEFREILLEAAKLRIISSQQTSSHVIYKIGKHYNPNKKWHVSHYDNGSNVDIKCSCKRMESFGMPCSHSVFLLLILDILQLPSCLVLERWTKKAKNVEGVNFQQCELSRESVKSSRYGALSDACRVLCNLACEKEEDFSEMLEKVYNECGRLRSKQHSSSMENVDNANVDQVRDPVRVRAKGRVPGITSRSKQGNQCGICREIGHNRASCPNIVGSCSRTFDNDFNEE